VAYGWVTQVALCDGLEERRLPDVGQANLRGAANSS
jgi:hypothetical protein